MLPAVTAIALVESMFMNTELVNSAPTGVAIITVYMPCTGFDTGQDAIGQAAVRPSIALVTAELRSLPIPAIPTRDPSPCCPRLSNLCESRTARARSLLLSGSSACGGSFGIEPLGRFDPLPSRVKGCQGRHIDA